jgi:hypothetical protein
MWAVPVSRNVDNCLEGFLWFQQAMGPLKLLMASVAVDAAKGEGK